MKIILRVCAMVSFLAGTALAEQGEIIQPVDDDFYTDESLIAIPLNDDDLYVVDEWHVSHEDENATVYVNDLSNVNVYVSNVPKFNNDDEENLVNSLSDSQNCGKPLDMRSEGLGYMLECNENMTVFVISNTNTNSLVMTDCRNNDSCAQVGKLLAIVNR
ncbi:MAG: hypothetical protein ACI4V7_05920 [Succinivibrionaceae bacterium]